MVDLVEAPTLEQTESARQALIELEMLREFFDCWETLHAMARQVAVPRRHKEAAAQRLVEAAHSIRAFRSPVSQSKLEVVK